MKTPKKVKPKRKSKKPKKGRLHFYKKRTKSRALLLLNQPKPPEIDRTAIIIISSDFKISYSYKYFDKSDNKRQFTKVNNVSLEVIIDGTPVTIRRYDNHDGQSLHVHQIIKGKDFKTAMAIPGEPKDWLTWAINDLMKNLQKYYEEYIENNQTTA